MTGHERESQLSAMFDGELPQEECELLARRLSRDEDMRRSYAHYALIGSVIRNEPMASQAFAAKVHGALRGPSLGAAESLAASRAASESVPESTVASASGSAAGSTRAGGIVRQWAWPLGAVGMAASVAAIALLSLDPSVIQGTPTPSSIASTESATPTTAVIEEVVTSSAPGALVAEVAQLAEVVIPSQPISLEPESYVTPPAEGLSDRRLAPAVQLANYVVAHGTVSVPMMRHSALSAFITDLEIAAGDQATTGSVTATGSAAATGSEAAPR